MLLKCYIVVLLTTAIDEQWNINNPRPNPIKKYTYLQWEKADFFTYKINNEWVLRPYRKTDTKLKKKVRKKYWEKRGKLKK